MTASYAIITRDYLSEEIDTVDRAGLEFGEKPTEPISPEEHEDFYLIDDDDMVHYRGWLYETDEGDPLNDGMNIWEVVFEWGRVDSGTVMASTTPLREDAVIG